jgi:hypothetical protein
MMDDEYGQTTEERFRDLIKEVHDRVHKIEFKKEDWKTYSEVQSEIDNFLDEATTEVMAIKNGLKRRFDNINAGRFEYKRKLRTRNKTKKPRSSKKANEESADNQNSVFANPI